jgi:hypothetical protein
MYSISSNKHFLPIYYKKYTYKECLFKKKYNLNDFFIENITNKILTKRTNKYFISKIYLCKYINWIYTYIFIYSITNIQKKKLNKKNKISYINYNTLYHTYLLNKYKHLL